jgi:glucose/arabinose dehydrogenase
MTASLLATSVKLQKTLHEVVGAVRKGSVKISKLVVLGALTGPVFGCSSGEGIEVGETNGETDQAVLHAIVGRTEAEAFETASGRFFDSDAAHTGNCGSGAVDQETTTDATGGGCNVGWTIAGEFLEYDVSVATAGVFNFKFRLASGVADRKISVRLDGVVIGTLTAPSGGWQAWGDVTINNVSIGAGNHVVRVTFDTNDVNFNYFEVTQATATGRSIASNLEAESNDGQTGLQFETCTEGGQNAGFVDVNDTLTRNIAVPSTGNYTVTTRSATWAATSVKVFVDNVEKTTLNLPATWTGTGNQYQTWQSFTSSAIALTQGTRALKLVFSGGNQNLNWAKVTASAPPTGVVVPAKIEAEAYNAFNESTPASNSGGACNRNDGVDMEATTDQSGVCSVGWTTAGEWLEYNIQSNSAQTVNLTARVASGATASKRFHFELDGVTVGGSQTVAGTSWTTYVDRTVSGVALSAGAHKVRVVFDDGDVNLNYVNVGTGAPPACVNNDPQGSTSLAFTRGDIRARIVSSGIGSAVRIAQSPLNGTVYVLDINGGIQSVNLSTGARTSVVASNDTLEVATNVKGHLDFTTVQGFAFGPDGKVYVVANSGGAQNTAVILRGTPSGTSFTWAEVMRTVAYPNSGTPFDHQWSGIVVRRESNVDYLYVNSGSRTDHGELQPPVGGVREVALTASMFRIPAASNAITLPNDRAQLVSNGYLFAEGLRNSFDPTFAPDGKLVSADNGPDSDYSEELNWIQQGQHYGFPWRLGNEDNAIQFLGYDAQYITNDYATPADNHDPRLHPLFYGYENRLYRYQTTLGSKPSSFVEPIWNQGPDADTYRTAPANTVNDASARGEKLGTFSAHRSPLGLSYDAANALCTDFRGDAFLLSWGAANPVPGMGDSTGQDLLHLDIIPVGTAAGFEVRTTRLVSGFDHPIDSIFIGNKLYVLENGASGRIFEISLPVPG